ncbi:hypothetical protein SPBR_03318 [Sporothrix brasiliensis 5110]|uniref:Uncharacterized protein n=1 Tax=Sporothrix brasiliensis 5110 TaxID=1398154 RepID=A0A0C2F236_9PEZI|nr:uncharacterized protein SPBR_03318 [Sporothrix brasiliensis 5110]KIH92994.1 hypothetical protein SPBR_03318 [Sporothrix brasiliensis 5110]
MAMATSPFSRNDYIDNRNIQGGQINAALRTIRTVIQDLQKELRTDFQSLNHRVDGTEQGTWDLKDDLLKCPISRVHPIAVRHPALGIMEPNRCRIELSMLPLVSKLMMALIQASTLLMTS